MKKPKLSLRNPKKVQETLVQNILAKLEDGQTLTKSEMTILRDFEQTGFVDGPSSAEWVSSYQVLGELLGCHRASFPRWRRQHSDCPKPRENGDHSVGAWRDWFKEHPEIRNEAGDLASELQKLQLEEMRQKVRKAVHINDVREGLYTKNEVIAGHITKVIGELRALLRQKFEFELPPYSAKQDAAQVRVLNKRAVDELCLKAGELAGDWKV